MSSSALTRAAVLAGVLAAACNAAPDEEAPAAQTTTGEQPRMEPMTVAGCLRAGGTENTFVLNVAKAEGASDAGTYHLTGTPGVNLRDHIDQEVRVTGTLRAEEQITSRTDAEQQDKARGTTGTPTVKTTTEVDVKQLEVSSVQASGSRC